MALNLLQLFPSILLLLLHSGTAHVLMAPHCDTNSSDSTFKKKLYGLLKSITTGAPKNGYFFNDTVGTGADQIYGLGICYADIDINLKITTASNVSSLSTCNSCLSSVASNLTTACPDSKVASSWQKSGPCFIRYSNENFFTVADTSDSPPLHSTRNFSDPELYGNARNALFDKLISETNASANMMAIGNESVSGSGRLNGLLQCTRDLNHQECYKCLSTFISILQPPSPYEYSFCVQYFGFSCYVHYETQEGVPSGPSPSPETAPSPTNPVNTTAGSLTVPGPNPASPTAGTVTKLPKKSITTIIVTVVGGVATLLVVITICIWFQRKWSPLGRTKLLIEELQEVAASEFQIYDLIAIRIATDNFSDKNTLGRGGFGQVFKGTFPNGQEIAVKRLSTSSTQGATEFKTEAELLVRLRHKNLVQLFGCCVSKDERILCYEYLPNGSLDNTLFGTDDIKCKELEWSRRYRIIKGICRGLLYLHEESPLKIVHRDLKASNILLDRDMNPKIADFGLARLFAGDQTHTVTARIAGTYGYIAPEYRSEGIISAKSDTYSFGILVLEIVLGRKNSSFPGSEFTSGLTNHVWKHWSEGKVLKLKDPTLNQECIEEVTQSIHIALLCLQAHPSNRPDMETVRNMLNSSSIASLPPLPPPRFIWGADVPTFEDDENVVANLSREYSVVGVESAEESFLSSFDRRA